MTRDLQKAQAMSETGIRNNEIAMKTHHFTLMDTAPVGWGGGCLWIALNLSCMVRRAEVGTSSLGLTGFPGASSHQITEESCSEEPLCRLIN